MFVVQIGGLFSPRAFDFCCNGLGYGTLIRRTQGLESYSIKAQGFSAFSVQESRFAPRERQPTRRCRRGCLGRPKAHSDLPQNSFFGVSDFPW